MMRQAWIDKCDTVTVTQQCVLAGVFRTTVYAQQKPKQVDVICCLVAYIDEEYTRRSFFGSRKMFVFLKKMGFGVNRKRVQRLMRQMGLAEMAPGPNTSCPHLEHCDRYCSLLGKPSERRRKQGRICRSRSGR